MKSKLQPGILLGRCLMPLCLCLLLLVTKQMHAQNSKPAKLNYKSFCFYYNWYGNPKHDGRYVHWAHPVMKSGPADTTTGYIPGGEDLASNFYPSLGAYSNSDKKVISKHMKMLRQAGIGNIVVTWWSKDDFMDKSIPLLMDEAAENNIKVCFHIEPVGGRNAATIRQSMEYLITKFGSHPAFYRSDEHGGKPFFFIYDSYLTKANEWAELLQPKGSISIRNTKYDAVMIGLWVKKEEEQFFLNSGFDGFYTYFASEGFTFGSTSANWPYLQKWAADNNKIFIPCVGPGYIDTRVRPWNGRNTKERRGGSYYDAMFSSAIQSGAPFIGITSFNEWHEGTQIEPAIPQKTKAFNYLDYLPTQPEYYLHRTKYWLNRYQTITSSAQKPARTR